MRSLCILFLVFLAGHLSAQTMKAVNDTIDLVPGVPKTVNLLANDTIPAGDSIKINGGVNFTRSLVVNTWKNKGWFTYVANQWGYSGRVEGTYQVVDITQQKTSTARIVFRIHDHSYDSLAINNIDARFNASGLNFALFFADPNGTKGFIVPRGSSKKTIFSGSVWLGGKDRDSNIYVSGERYRQGNVTVPGAKPDYYAGPVMDSANYSVYQDTLWNYIWNLKKTDIDYHKLHWQDAGYQPVHDILTWPGNGNVNLGEAAQLAPYFDRNQDGKYNPMDGDYPLIRGDQALYFIFNENRGPHQESGGGRSFKAEFHAMAYGWDMPGDSAFKNTIFMNYKIFNRSQRTYYNTSLGIFTDLDLGYMLDDLIGCDVYRGSYFGYNGRAVDGTGQAYAYGDHPPAQSITILAGPEMDPAGADRPRVDGSGHQLCNESVNGTGFGDGIADNERMGLSNFFSILPNNGITPEYYGDPTNAAGYFHYLHGMWLDSTYMVYGGSGHTGAGGYGPRCRFMFPAESDTVNWGTGCQPPNGLKNWTSTTAGVAPGDIRGVGSVGPFTFRPGGMKELDIAYVFARDYTSPDTLASVTRLMHMIDTIRHAFIANKLPGGGSFTGVGELPARQGLGCTVYPNPATSLTHIVFNEPLGESSTVRVYDARGRLMSVKNARTLASEVTIDLRGMSSGLYLLVIQSPGMTVIRKLSVLK
ncbi:MAG: T9SS type A sorting domain-containing protein [Bacteroidota bacterium]